MTDLYDVESSLSEVFAPASNRSSSDFGRLATEVTTGVDFSNPRSLVRPLVAQPRDEQTFPADASSVCTIGVYAAGAGPGPTMFCALALLSASSTGVEHAWVDACGALSLRSGGRPWKLQLLPLELLVNVSSSSLKLDFQSVAADDS